MILSVNVKGNALVSSAFKYIRFPAARQGLIVRENKADISVCADIIINRQIVIDNIPAGRQAELIGSQAFCGYNLLNAVSVNIYCVDNREIFCYNISQR